MGESLDALELMIRGGAVAVYMALAVWLARVDIPKLRLSGFLFAITTAAHVLTQAAVSRAVIAPVIVPIWVLSVMGTGFFWTFATDLFSDAHRSLQQRFGPALVLLLLGLLGILAEPYGLTETAWIAQDLLSLALMGHAFLVIALCWRDDLVESRRQLRGPILAAGALYGVINAIIQVGELVSGRYTNLSILPAVVLLGLSLAGAIAFLKPDPRLFTRSSRRPAPPEASPQDLAVLSRLTNAMDEEEAWRREALTMFDLAKLVGAPEHRLRRLINDHLGYRNFSAFLNERRIAAAKTALADVERAQIPVSSVAYEVGFASLGPFNRAFKAATGQTPSQWRETQVLA